MHDRAKKSNEYSTYLTKISGCMGKLRIWVRTFFLSLWKSRNKFESTILSITILMELCRHFRTKFGHHSVLLDTFVLTFSRNSMQSFENVYHFTIFENTLTPRLETCKYDDKKYDST